MHDQFMLRCFDLALKGLGSAAPNPLVGCVIVSDNKIIGEGYHREFGKAHAEVNAIESVPDKNLLQHSTLYVNLEPCSHHGKTPPCADLIITNKIPHVVIGCADSFEEVNGRGIEKLKVSGVKVETGVLESESRTLNKRFFTLHQKQRPYVILKWAQTEDGFISHKSPDDKNQWISNEQSQLLVHKWRSEEQAIMVGANTVIADNPLLTVRKWPGKNPLRIVVDKNLDIPAQSRIFTDGLPVVILNGMKDSKHKNLIWKKVDLNNHAIQNILSALHQMQIQSVFVEGGKMLHRSFIDSGLWDEARVFVSQGKIYSDGISAPVLSALKTSEEKIMNDTLYYYSNPP